MKRALLLAALGSLVACAPAPFTPPSRGGAAWTETTSEHFSLYTDLAPADARDVSADLERTFAVLADIGFKAKTKPTTHLDVVSFRREDEYHKVAPEQTRGVFLGLKHDIDSSSIAMFYGPLTAATRAVLQHELTHAFVNQYFPNAPTWLNEGLAKYFETLTFDGEYVYLGRMPRSTRFTRAPYRVAQEDGELVAYIPAFDVVPMTDLLRWSPSEFYGDRGPTLGDSSRYDAARVGTTHYASAWALVHVLISSPRFSGNFATYLSNLRRLGSASEAWDRAFPAAVLPDLDAEYRQSILAPNLEVLRVKYEPSPPPTVNPVTMNDDDVSELWKRIGYGPGRKKGAR